MKKFLLFLMFALCCIPWVANAQTVTIGTGTSAHNSAPIANYYNYSLAEMLFTSAEIGTTDVNTILSIGFEGAAASSKTYGITVYMKNVDATSFSANTDYIQVSSDDIVYTGSIKPASGWNTIELAEPFAYDNTKSLLVVVNKTSGGYDGNTSIWKYTSTSSPYMMLYAQNDGSGYDPTTLTTLATSAERPNVQLTFGTPPSCSAPTSVTATADGNVTWEGEGSTWNLNYKASSASTWTEVNGLTSMSYTIPSLTGLTTYSVRVQNVCDDNSTTGWTYADNFTTPAGIPLVENFNTTSLPTGWTKYTGLLDDVMAGTLAPATTTSGWYFGTSNGVFDSHARVNIYSTSCKYWLVTPSLEMENNVQLTFDLALTKYSGTLQPVDPEQQADDRFVVLIATFGADTTLTILREWNNTGSEYVYNNIACSAIGENVAIDLSSYAGQNIAIAFYGESTESGGDNNLHIDNVSINYIPNCAIPTGVGKSNVTAHTADISWTSEASAWEVAYKAASAEDFTTVTVNENPYTLSGLTPETSYTVKVRANCDGTFSEWTTPVSFTTAIACPAPTGLVTSNITGHGVTVTWNAEEGAMYQYQMVKTSDYDPDHIYWSGSTQSNPLSWSNLDPETNYTLALRKDCSSANDGYSQVVTKTFTTGEACPAPTGLAASDITGHTATLNWNGTSDSYVVSYRTKAYTEGVYEQFNNSGVPSGWTRYSGLVDEVVAGTATLVTTTSGWSTTTYALGTYNIKVNIWGSSAKYWLVTPEFTLDQNLSFDLALTDYGNSDPIEDNTAQADDRFVVLIYANNAWTILREWNNSGSEYVYNNISSTGENFAIDLSAYYGQNVKIAFYGESTASGGDNDLHIDNVFCGTPIPAGEWQTVTTNQTSVTISGLDPETQYEAKVQGDCGEEDGVSLESSILTFTTDVACPAPTNVVMSEITTTTAVIDWVDKAGASAWYITYDPANPDLHQTYATFHPYTLTGLTPDSTYNLQVAAVCGGSDGVSEWSPVVTFTTLPLCQAPTNLDTANVTAHTADMSWTGNGDSYKVYLGACPFYFSTAFANGIPSEMTNDATYPWTIVDGYIKSSNGGVSSSTSAISVTFDYPEDGVIEFDAECKGEGTSSYWDHCDFYIDDTRMLYAGANISGWNHYSYNVTAGLHTFSWKYTKDSSVNPTGDYFAVDNIVAQAGDIVWADPVTAEGEEYSFTGLEGGNTYFVQLQSICGEDESGLSEAFDFTTPISCFVPTEAMVTYTVGITAEVSWTSDAESFNIDLNGTIIENVTNPYTLENLDYSTDYTVKVQAVCGAGDVSKWATAGSFTTEEFCPAPTEFTYALSSDGATVTWDGTSDSYNVRYRALLDPVFSDDFENGIDNWTIVAGATATAPSGGIWYTIDPTGGLSFESHSATYCASSWSWNSSVYQADNWLISPQINLQGVLKYYVRTSSGWPDSYEVRLSTQTNDTASFDVVLKAMAPAPANGKWNEVIIDLSAYDGVSGYIAFHHVDYDMNYLVLDDIGVYPVGDWNTTSVTESTCALTDLELATYEWQVQGVCDGETGAWSSSQFIDFTPVDCEAGIVLNESNNYTWTADFEGITNITKLFTGVTPSCWTVAHEYTSPSINHIGLEADTLPQLYRSFNTTDGGQYSLRMKYRSLLAMPVLDESVDMSRLQMTLNVRQPQTYYKLQIGVMSDLNDESTFVPVATVNNASTSMEEFVCNFSSYNGEGRYIAFKNVGGSKVDPYCSNYLDDIVLTYIDAESCKIPVPYSQDFESFTTSGGASGVEPDCWEVISEDVSLDATTRPQVYRGFNTTAGGHYSLRMKNRCVYAMPEFAEDVDVKELTLSFSLRQAKSFYRLEVGVVDAAGNFVVVEEINNPSTSMEDVTVDFSTLDGEGTGKRIAFHNILRNSANYDYSYNYIDDINLYYTSEGPEGDKIMEFAGSDEMNADHYLDNIAVYPNPTTGMLHIDAVDVQKVECYSQMGQLVGVYDNVNELNISELANGVYMLRITVPQGVTMRKVVKR